MEELVQVDYCAGSRDQRADQRLTCAVPIEWVFFNALERFHGRMTDVSAQGGCVESNQPVMPGDAVFVRLMSSDGSGTDRILRQLMLAEVKWCRPLLLESSRQYRFGVKCFEYL
jgi:hypothetical protein